MDVSEIQEANACVADIVVNVPMCEHRQQDGLRAARGQRSRTIIAMQHMSHHAGNLHVINQQHTSLEHIQHNKHPDMHAANLCLHFAAALKHACVRV